MFLCSLWQNKSIIHIYSLGKKLGNMNTFSITMHLNNSVITVGSLFNKRYICLPTMDHNSLEHIESRFIKQSKFFQSNFPKLSQRPWPKISTDQIIQQFYLHMVRKRNCIVDHLYIDDFISLFT